MMAKQRKKLFFVSMDTMNDIISEYQDDPRCQGWEMRGQLSVLVMLAYQEDTGLFIVIRDSQS